MKIHDITIAIIRDSRGQDTLEATMSWDNNGQIMSASASAPSGKSTGIHEAFVLEPTKAQAMLESIKQDILAKDFASQKEFDDFLIALDGTENKSRLGGNLILVLSLAFAHIKAQEEGKELFRYIRDISGLEIVGNRMVRYPIFNVINGGAHADNKLDFQEFQVIPMVEGFAEALRVGKEFYEKLGEAIRQKFGAEQVTLGDEAGYSAPFENNEEAIALMKSVIAANSFQLRIGLDAAASSFFRDGGYTVEGGRMSSQELLGMYYDLIYRYNILSLEDPFEEEAFGDFKTLYTRLNQGNLDTMLITDDLTTTNPQRFEHAIREQVGNTILIKLNQIGSLTETLRVVRMAYSNNWKVIVSHRSGETMDDFIADLAVAVGAWGLKSGAPGKPERLAKYERVIAIEEMMKQGK
jgi:enolase